MPNTADFYFSALTLFVASDRKVIQVPAQQSPTVHSREIGLKQK